VTLTTPLSGKIVISRMGLAMVNLCAKFEVFRCTRYEATCMNGDAKCRKWGGLGWLGALKVMGDVAIPQSAYDFLFNFNRNYGAICIVFEI